MAPKAKIEYINDFYSYGSEAKIIEFVPQQEQPKTTLPKPVQEKKLCILVDPVALCGLIVAVLMFCVMGAGLLQYREVCTHKQVVSEYVNQLRDENLLLKHNYRRSYDLDKVRETALALGMVPASEVTCTRIWAPIAEPEPENTWWDDFLWSWSNLFA